MHDLKALCETKRRAGIELTVKDFADGSDFFEFSGVATTPKKDFVGDIVEPMGAQFALPLVLLSKHDSTKPIGEVFFAKATKAGIPYKARIPYVKEAGLVQDRVNEAIHEVKYGLTKAVSIGFKALRDGVELLEDGGLRFMKWVWLELSLVPLPANDEATITAFKSIDDGIRAALGALDTGKNGREHSERPGATGAAKSPKGKAMRTIKALQERRDEVAARIQELNTGCGGDFATLGDAEMLEFDDLSKELQDVDVDIRRLKAVEVAVSGATAITPDAGSDPTAGTRARRGIPREPKKPAAEKGIAFAQYVKFLGRAKGNPMQALAMANAQKGNIDPRVAMILKADVEGGTVTGTPTAGNWGMELVGSETSAFADFLEFLRPKTILGKFGQGGVPSLNRVPFRVPLLGMTAGGTGYWVGEGKAKPVTKFGFSRTHLDPLKVAALTVVSMELLEDSSPSADGMIRTQLANALHEREDTTFIDPNEGGTPGSTPASITNGITPIASSGNTAADVRTDIKAVFGTFIAANNAPTTGVWIMSQRTALALSLMNNALGQTEDFAKNITMNGGTFGGLPVVTSEYVTGDSSGGMVYLVNAGEIYYGDNGDVKVDTSEHATIEMSDAPTGDLITPAAATNKMVSMFQSNGVAFRAERRLDWMRARETAVAALSGVNWG